MVVVAAILKIRTRSIARRGWEKGKNEKKKKTDERSSTGDRKLKRRRREPATATDDDDDALIFHLHVYHHRHAHELDRRGYFVFSFPSNENPIVISPAKLEFMARRAGEQTFMHAFPSGRRRVTRRFENKLMRSLQKLQVDLFQYFRLLKFEINLKLRDSEECVGSRM